MTRSRACHLLLVAALLALALAWFGSLDLRKLVTSDEGRYAEIAREMATSGDWITPRYNGVKYFEKPVLLYWATAAAFRLFGESEWAARLWVALTGFAGVLVLGATVRTLLGAQAALYAATLLAAAPLWFIASHVNSTDMGVSFFLLCAMCCGLLGLRDGLPARQARGWMLGSWAAMALAVLSKGLIGIVIPGMVFVAYVIVARDWRVFSKLHWAAGSAVFLLIAAPWFIAVTWRNPEFAHYFFVHEHFGRFTRVEGYNRAGPWWYFPALLAVTMLPWTPAFLVACASLFRHGAHARSDDTQRTKVIALLWVLVVVGFFSISRSKLPGYVVPAVPTFALLAGLALLNGTRALWIATISCVLVAGAAAVALGIRAADLAPVDAMREPYTAYGRYILASGALLMAAGAVSLALARSDRVSGWRPGIVVGLLAVGTHISCQFWIAGHDTLRAKHSSFDLAMEIRSHVAEADGFYAVHTFDHTLPFYVKRTLMLVEHYDELEFGLRREPHLGVATIDAFVLRWNIESRPVALMKKDTYERLSKQGMSMSILARDVVNERMVVVKPKN